MPEAVLAVAVAYFPGEISALAGSSAPGFVVVVLAPDLGYFLVPAHAVPAVVRGFAAAVAVVPADPALHPAACYPVVLRPVAPCFHLRVPGRAGACHRALMFLN